MKKKLKTAFLIIIQLCIGFSIGIGLVSMIELTMGCDFSFTTLLLLLLMLFLAYLVNVILHEGGHLVMGLLTGYRFLSFRVLSLMLVKDENGRYRFTRFSIPGTLGQCLLIPPELDENGHMPNILYNLGGVMVNLLIAVICGVSAWFMPGTGIFRTFLAMMAMVSIMMFLENAIPLGSLGITNDGANIVMLRKSRRVVLSLWKQLMVNAYQTQGKLFRDMPDELFVMPDEKDMADELVTAEAVFIENRLMEEMDNRKTLETIDYILDTDSIRLISIYRTILESDRLLLKLLEGIEVETPSRSFRKQLKGFSVFPDVLVCRYAVARLLDEDEKEAERIRKQFEKMMKSYPYETDRYAMPKYMEMVDRKAEETDN